MKLFIIPSWYPTEIHPESGTFFRDRAQILHQSGIEVVVAAPVTHSLKDLIRFTPNKSIQPKIDEGLRIYLLERINIFPKMEKLFFARYKKIALTVFNRSLETHGIPDLILIHGDRIESLGCALVGSLNHILTAHIEGGEVSGIDG